MKACARIGDTIGFILTMSFKTSKGKRKTEHEFADEVKSMLRPKGEVTYAPVEFLNAPALLHFGATNNELEGESGDSVAHYSSKDSTGSSSKKKSSARSSSSTGSLGCTWASLPGKKLKLDANPLAVQARDGGGIDDATCLEVTQMNLISFKSKEKISRLTFAIRFLLS